ncbi:hypothetical protein JTE90_021514 [Oedothorax gibbosus]|uniref:Uncharacterized protein n=1 Tax=Oedothorax gibbosus TaxID=931172 RepID=A0AAV6VQV0_9ARAC|nr:hypothetical protein JTE90_021514 [Oedothorax gibbosus]
MAMRKVFSLRSKTLKGHVRWLKRLADFVGSQEHMCASVEVWVDEHFGISMAGSRCRSDVGEVFPMRSSTS